MPNAQQRYYICRQKTAVYTNYAIVGKYNHEVTADLLSAALRRIISENSVFTLSMVEDTDAPEKDKTEYKNFRVVPVERIDFDDVVEYVDEPFNVHQLEVINVKVCPLGPKVTWRVLVYANNYLCFYNNHMFLDGESSVHFHQDLCAALDTVSKQPEPFSSILFTLQPQKFSMPVMATDLSLFKSSWSFLVKTVLREVPPARLLHLYHYYTSKGYPDYTKYPFFRCNHRRTTENRFRLLKVDKPMVEKLLGLCRHNGVTITAFLDVLIRYCIYQTKPQNSLQSYIVISGRRYLSAEEKEKYRYGFLVTVADVRMGPVPQFDDSSVPLMHTVKKSINKGVESKEGFQLFGLFDYVSPNKAIDPDDHVVRNSVAFEISNLGSRDVSAGQWAVEDMVFTGCLGTSGALAFNIVSGSSGMNLALGYAEEYEDTVEAVEKTFYKVLETLDQRF